MHTDLFMAQEVLLSGLLLEGFSSYQPSSGVWKQESGLMTSNLFLTLSTGQSRLVVLQCNQVVANFQILPQLTLVSLCPKSWLVTNPHHCETCVLRFGKTEDEATKFGELFIKCQKAAGGELDVMAGFFGSRAAEEMALEEEWECKMCHCGNDKAERHCVACVWPRGKAPFKVEAAPLRVKSPRKQTSSRASGLSPSLSKATTAVTVTEHATPVFAFNVDALETLKAGVCKRPSQDASEFGRISTKKIPYKYKSRT
ncbi:hypothetical protein BASA82_000227 [Batrachochytrium salamandrivorans]|nr:hypothetical protein BASA81_002217 [Batrachochytrium salamandrivorans]KAH9262736.1 hypothetical protein BASA82_000227 [Batrachochytrium salamandrivorans]